MDRIEIISPVHVGTGEKIEAPSFYRIGDETVATRYNFADILSQMPSSVLTNPSFLNSLSRKQSSKNELYQNIQKYVDYDELNALYKVADNNVEDIAESGYDVYEQIKDLNRPYIPGSSIKGALLNAWMYYFIKRNYNEKYIEMILKDSNNIKNKTIIDYLCPIAGNHTDFIKALQSCIQCEDIYFDEIEVLWSERIGSGKDMQESMPMSYTECIKKNQISEGNVFRIDSFKKKLLMEQLTDYVDKNLDSKVRFKIIKVYENILKALNRKMIMDACNVFTQDILEIERSSKYIQLYKDFEFDDVNIQTKNIINDISSIKSEKKHEYILRIGKSTNYFSKSITYLIKVNSPHLYQKYFRNVLSPSTWGRTEAKSFSLPKTRTVFSNYEESYLPGFIRVTYD